MPMLRRTTIIFSTIAFVALLTYGGITGSAATAPVRVAVLVSHNAKPYQEALEGFKERLSAQGIETKLDIYPLEGDAAKALPALRNLKDGQVNLLFTLGSLATSTAIKSVNDVPIIAGLVLSTDEIRSKANVTGVALEFPFEIQFQWLSRMLPDSKNVGVLYNPARNLQKVESANKIAQSMGFRLFAQKVETPAELPDALESLARRVDVVLGLADDLIFTPQTAKPILLFSFRNHIPLVGLSAEWVKAGALYSLDWDYKDIGMQCAEMAQKVLQGKPANSNTPVSPRKVLYSVNLKTAVHMKTQIPENLVQDSHQVFK
jgi:putative tryptophan/tyrosine transport system substrate-binding protein